MTLQLSELERERLDISYRTGKKLTAEELVKALRGEQLAAKKVNQ